jgi:hypothetical protein
MPYSQTRREYLKETVTTWSQLAGNARSMATSAYTHLGLLGGAMTGAATGLMLAGGGGAVEGALFSSALFGGAGALWQFVENMESGTYFHPDPEVRRAHDPLPFENRIRDLFDGGPSR